MSASLARGIAVSRPGSYALATVNHRRFARRGAVLLALAPPGVLPNWLDAPTGPSSAFDSRRERMSFQATETVDVSVDVSLRVPRGETGDLESGVADVLANVDGVTGVTVERITSVRPTWTDVRVDADVRLVVEAEPDGSDHGNSESDVEACLEDGFGVTDVNALVVDGPE